MAMEPRERGVVDTERIRQQMALDKIEKTKAETAAKEKAAAETKAKADAAAKAAKEKADKKAAEDKAKAEKEAAAAAEQPPPQEPGKHGVKLTKKGFEVVNPKGETVKKFSFKETDQYGRVRGRNEQYSRAQEHAARLDKKPTKEAPKAQVESMSGKKPNENGVFDDADADELISYKGSPQDAGGRTKAQVEIRLLQLKDGTWINGLIDQHHQGNYSGQSYGLGTKGRRFATRNEALVDAMRQAQRHQQNIMGDASASKGQREQAGNIVTWLAHKMETARMIKEGHKPKMPPKSEPKFAQMAHSYHESGIVPKGMAGNTKFWNAVRAEGDLRALGKSKGQKTEIIKPEARQVLEQPKEPPHSKYTVSESVALPGEKKTYGVSNYIDALHTNIPKYSEFGMTKKEAEARAKELNDRPPPKEEAAPGELKVGDIVSFNYAGKPHPYSGVISELRPDGRLTVDSMGGETYTIRPADVTARGEFKKSGPLELPKYSVKQTIKEGKKTSPGLTITDGPLHDPNGVIEAKEMPDGSLQIQHVAVKQGMKGQGIGKGLYAKLIDEAKGRKIVSDSSVSPEAARVWESLRKEGRDIYKNPKAKLVDSVTGKGKEWQTADMSPVYEVGKPKESATGKPLRKSYEIMDDMTQTQTDLFNASPKDRPALEKKMKALEQELTDLLNPENRPTALETPDELAALNKISREKFGKDYDKLGVRQKAKVDAAYESPNLPLKARKPRPGYSLDPKTKREYHFSDELRSSVTPIEGSNAFLDANAIFATHNGITLEAVDPPFVPESGADPRSGELGPIDKAYQIARVLNRPIGWYRGPSTLGAFYWKGELFFNIDMLRDQDPLHVTAAHEISHWIQFERPQMYKALYNELTSRAGTKGYKDYLAALEARAKGVYNEAEKRHEVVAEFVADVLKDSANFTEALGKNPSLMQRVGRGIRDWIDKTLRKLGITRERKGWGDIRGVAGDLTKARGMVMDMLKEARETKVASKQDYYYPALSVRGELPKDRETRPSEKDQKHLDKVGGENLPQNRNSTRHPSADGAPDSKKQQLDISMDGIYGSEKNTRNMADKMRLAGLPKDLHTKDHKGLIQNAVKFFKENKLLDWKKLQTLPQRIREGAPNQYVGYNKAGIDMAKHYDTTPKRVFGMESVLSSEKPPDQSFSMTQRMLKIYRDAGDKVWDKDFTKAARSFKTPISSAMLNRMRGKGYHDLLDIHEKAMWIKTYDAVYNEPWYRAVTPEGRLGDYVRNQDGTRTRMSWNYPDVMARAILIMEGHVDPVQVVNGHKQGMYNNNKNAPIENNRDYTSDVHDINSSYHDSFSSGSTLGKRRYAESYHDRATGDRGSYALHVEAGNQGAKEVGVLPSKFQAGTWTVQQMLRSQRRLRSASTEGKAVIDAINNTWKDAERGKLTRQEARAKVDRLVADYHAANGGLRYPDWVRDFNPAHQIDPAELNTIGKSYRELTPEERAPGQPEKLSQTRGISEGPEPGDLGGSAERGVGERPSLAVSGELGKTDPERVTWYHGTRGAGEKIAKEGFQTGPHTDEYALYGPGHYFTDNPDVAEGYATKGFVAGAPVKLLGGSIIPVHIDVRHPFEAEKWMGYDEAINIAEKVGRPDLADNYRSSARFIEERKRTHPEENYGKPRMGPLYTIEGYDPGMKGGELWNDLVRGDPGVRLKPAELNKKLQEMGYDGITYDGGKIVGDRPHNVVVAFDPKQVQFKYAPVERPPMSATGPIEEPADAGAKRFEAWKEYAQKNKLDVNNMPMFQKWLDTAQSEWLPGRGSRGKMGKYNPFAILKTVYAAAQKAGREGFKRGTAEEKEVAAYELAYQARQHKEQLTAQRKAGLDALGELRRQFQNADAWMAADQEKVRKQMVDFVETVLPKNERSEFLGRITRAMKRPPMGKGKVSDPVIMHRHAFEVMRDIEDRAVEVYKRDIIDDVKNTLKKSLDAPGIDVAYRRKLKQIYNSISLVNPSKKTLAKLKSMQDHIDRATKAGRDPGIPQKHLDELKRLTQLPLKDMPVGALEALQSNIDTTVGLGRMKAKMLKDRWDKTRDDALTELSQQPSMPLEERPIYTPNPTEKLSVADKFFNSVNKTMNLRGFVESALSPMDEIYDHMDGALGTYNGWTSRHYKGQLDLAFNERESEFHPIEKQANAIIQQHHLTESDMHTVQMKAIMLMKDVGRQRLEAMGPDPKSPEGARYKAILDKVEATPLTRGQQAYYDFIRKQYDAIGPRISDVAHQLYQIDMLPVENYVPLERDWAAHLKGKEPKPMADPSEGEVPFNETATMDQLQRDVNPGKVSRTEQGFLEERKAEAKTPVKLNAHEVFLRHMRDGLHFIHAQPVLKMLGEMTRDEAFKAKYGKLAQNIVLDHLDSIANNGYVSNEHRWRGLDWARNATSKAAVGFRLASGIVHTSQIPLAFVHAGGPHWWLYGLHKAMTKEGQLFLRRHGAETFVRGGGEPSQVEAENLAAQRYGQFGRLAFMLPRVIDKFNAQATFLGRYAKEMHDKGIGLDGLLSKPVAADSQALALRRMHRAVASPLAKDVPQTLSRGKMFGGNVSIARAVNQFKNIFLDNWSAIRHDILRVGVKDAADVIRLMRQGEIGQGVKRVADAATHRSAIALAMIAGIAIETGIKLYTQKALAAGMHKLTGVAPPPEQSKREDEKTFLGEFKHHALNRIPFMGQIASAAMYGGTGVPLADAIIDVAKEPYLAIAKSKKPETRAKHLVRSASALSTALGIPGSTQALQLAEPWLAHHLGKVLPEYHSTRTGRPGAHSFGPYPTGGKSKYGPYPGGGGKSKFGPR